jgi:hypothetical protein
MSLLGHPETTKRSCLDRQTEIVKYPLRALRGAQHGSECCPDRQVYLKKAQIPFARRSPLSFGGNKPLKE